MFVRQCDPSTTVPTVASAKNGVTQNPKGSATTLDENYNHHWLETLRSNDQKPELRSAFFSLLQNQPTHNHCRYYDYLYCEHWNPSFVDDLKIHSNPNPQKITPGKTLWTSLPLTACLDDPGCFLEPPPLKNPIGLSINNNPPGFQEQIFLKDISEETQKRKTRRGRRGRGGRYKFQPWFSPHGQEEISDYPTYPEKCSNHDNKTESPEYTEYSQKSLLNRQRFSLLCLNSTPKTSQVSIKKSFTPPKDHKIQYEQQDSDSFSKRQINTLYPPGLIKTKTKQNQDILAHGLSGNALNIIQTIINLPPHERTKLLRIFNSLGTEMNNEY